ncbi:MAG: hypothetical protein QOI11_2865 [Candidatus Eremiobacteraeota bacterium]|jgi:hypothetical protein|nr:hypothetical protein [Candidatus Eremiobacteraeota bacterium]
MTNRGLALVLSFVWAAAPLAVSAEAIKPLRSLTYELRVTVGVVRSIERDAIGTAGSTHGDFAGGEGSQGTITVDVIAATDDRGIVADVRENAEGRSRPVVRVAITGEGTLTYDPRQSHNVTGEEDALLRWLARDFVSLEVRAPGAIWNVDTSSGNARGAEHYRVVSADGSLLKLDYKAESKSSGIGSGDMTRAGTVVYDARMSVPTSANYKDIIHRQQLGTYDTTEMAVQLRLVADSFAKK